MSIWNTRIDRKQLIALEILLLLLLIGSSFMLNKRTVEFGTNCRINYTLESSCPCRNMLLNSTMYNNNFQINVTNLFEKLNDSR